MSHAVKNMTTTKPKILVADDEEFNLDNILFHLTEAGYDVIGAEDGALAFEKLKCVRKSAKRFSDKDARQNKNSEPAFESIKADRL